MDIENTLEQRQSTHGDFAENAECAQHLKRACRSFCSTTLTVVQAEAIENICQKLARILTGNPNHADNWHDIAGYATLGEKNCDNN